jgi:tetratricopeptide (TPR) repeat protein
MRFDELGDADPPPSPVRKSGMTRTCLLAVLPLLVLACHPKSTPAEKSDPAPAAVAAGRDRAADPDAALPVEMRLGLQKLPGEAGADGAVTEAQANVRPQLTKDDLWVTLGRAWVRKARESNDPGFYLNAEACASVVLARNPDNSLALNLRGLVLLNQHKFADARDLAARVLAKRADDAMAWGTLSDALLEMGRYEEAADAAQKMIDLKPNLPSYSRAAHLQWLHGDLRNARETVRLAIDSGRDTKRDPEPGAWAIVQAAMMFWHAGDYEGAEAGFDKALERFPEYAPANVGKGRVAMARGDHRRAAELFGRAYAVSPLVETAWLLGDARSAAGDATGAKDAYAKVERDGMKTDPRTLSLFLSAKNERSDEALRLAREEYAVRKDIVTEDAVAWALYRSGKIAEAKESIVRARRLGTPDARLLFHEGAIRLASGEAKRGRELLARARAMNPAFDASAAKELDALLASAAAPEHGGAVAAR